MGGGGGVGSQAAVAAARRELEAGQVAAAILAMEGVAPYVQPRSRLGASALFALASAHEHAEKEDEARAVYEQLLSHPLLDVRRQARSQLSSVRSRIQRIAGRGASRWWAPWDAWGG